MAKRLTTLLILTSVLLLPTSHATADFVKFVQGVPFDMDWSVAQENTLNGGLTWMDEDSGKMITSIVDGSGNVVGISLATASGTHVGDASYFGGIFRFSYIEDSDGTTIYKLGDATIGYNREITGIFYGLQLSGITKGTNVKAIHDGTGYKNIEFTSSNTDATVTVTLTGGDDSHFEMWVDHYTLGTPFDDTSADLSGTDFKDGTPSSSDWDDASDSWKYTTPLLTGKFPDTLTVTLEFDVVEPTTGDYRVQLGDLSGISDTAITVTGGALFPFVDYWDNHPDPDAKFHIKDIRLAGGVKVGGSLVMPETTKIGWGTTPPVTQTCDTELKDESQAKLWLSVPEPAAVAFMAPPFLGFVGCAVSRFLRRKKEKAA